MNSYNITDQVLSQLEWYADRINYLQLSGRTEDAELLARSAQLMADFADQQEEWLIVESN